MDEVADEAGHGDAAVLDLGLAQEADRRLVALLPEVLVAELERVEVAHDRVLLLGERLRRAKWFCFRYSCGDGGAA